MILVGSQGIQCRLIMVNKVADLEVRSGILECIRDTSICSYRILVVSMAMITQYQCALAACVFAGGLLRDLLGFFLLRITVRFCCFLGFVFGLNVLI